MPKINEEISNLINNGKEDTVIIYHLYDHFSMSLSEATAKLKEAKLWMGWYARKDVKDHA